MRSARPGFWLCLSLALVIILAWPAPGSTAYSSPLWGDLKPGPHRVGFRTIFTHDLSRAPLGKSAVPGRQMQINIWYPARVAPSASPMRFSEYVHLLARQVDFAPLGPRQNQQGEAKFLEQPSDLGGNAATLKNALPLILGLKTASFRDASPVKGRFPLIIFPDFRAPATNSIMCEHLASHGFVVATTSLKGTHEVELDVGLTGIETIASDIAFVIGNLKALPMVDRDRIALMGVGISASGCMALLTRNPEIDALISLDGGIPTSFEDRLLKRTPYFDISAARAPLLGIHAPHANVDPAFFDQYKYSPRHLVHFPKMSEFHFLNYGMLERFSPEIIGKPPGDTKAGFEWASLYVLNFLNAYLKKDDRALEFLRNQPEANAAPKDLLVVKKIEALRAAPGLSGLKEIIRTGGIQALVSLYRELKPQDPQPFSQDMIVALYGWLAFQRDPDWKGRRELSAIRVDSYPDSSRAHFTMAQVALQLAERDVARKHFSEALRLLETDADPLLDFQTRRRIGQVAKERLKTLED